jgi:hypothetical protein
MTVTPDQQTARVRDQSSRKTSLLKFHRAHISWLQASQIAAALLFDLAVVDIR